MFHYRQALVRMRQGDSDRQIATARIMGRRLAARLREFIVTNGRNDTPNDCNWNQSGTEFGPWGASKAQGRKPAYFTMAAFIPEKVERFKGRTKSNAAFMRGFWIDIEGSAEKYDKPGGAEGGYRG
jgi:hypothetical protein